MRRSWNALYALGMLTYFVASGNPSMAQSNVRYFEDDSISKESLIETLKPLPKRPLTRGLGQNRRGITIEPNAPMHVGPKRARCDQLRNRIARDGAHTPVSSVVAMKIEFAFDSTQVSSQSQRNLEILAEALKSPELQGYCFEVQGHTDSIGPEQYNLRLSQRRANSVIDYLSRHGVETVRLLPMGLGESSPIANNDTDTGRQRNRRVQILNLGSSGYD